MPCTWTLPLGADKNQGGNGGMQQHLRSSTSPGRMPHPLPVCSTPAQVPRADPEQVLACAQRHWYLPAYIAAFTRTLFCACSVVRTLSLYSHPSVRSWFLHCRITTKSTHLANMRRALRGFLLQYTMQQKVARPRVRLSAKQTENGLASDLHRPVHRKARAGRAVAHVLLFHPRACVHCGQTHTGLGLPQTCTAPYTAKPEREARSHTCSCFTRARAFAHKDKEFTCLFCLQM